MKYKNNLKELRLAKGLTQKDIADKIDIAYTAYQRYEHGKVIPGVDIALRIARVLGVRVEDIWG